MDISWTDKQGTINNYANSSKPTEPGSYLNKSVTETKLETYIHIELGAGNPTQVYQFPKRDNASVPLEQKDIHARSCKCSDCGYSSNQHRYAILANTIDVLAKQNPEQNVLIYLNDIDWVAMDQSCKFAREHIRVNGYEKRFTFKVEALPGDYFSLNLKQYKPNSVHLKNPEPIPFRNTITTNFKGTMHHLTTECSECDAGGFYFVTVDTNAMIVIFQREEINKTNLILENVSLDFDTTYHLPKIDPNKESAYLQNRATLLCKLPFV